jgi:AraC-like DNA-binding protein
MDGIHRFDFSRRKYGPELLVDVARIGDLPNFVFWGEPYWLSFYDITLVTGGTGRLWLDDAAQPVRPGSVLFTTPGQVRRWQVDDLRGVALFFPGEFIATFFSDPLFLHRLGYFHQMDGRHSVQLSQREAAELASKLDAMRSEIATLRQDTEHVLRAGLYEVLMWVSRRYARSAGTAAVPGNATVLRFLDLVEREYASLHRVGDYADRLAVSSGHLTELCKRRLGRTAGAVIRGRVIVEARRRLLHTQATAARIAADIGFQDPAYFSRFFRRETGASPSEFRRAGRAAYGYDVRPAATAASSAR